MRNINFPQKNIGIIMLAAALADLLYYIILFLFFCLTVGGLNFLICI